MRRLVPPKKDKRGDFTGILYMIVSIAALAMVLLIGGYIAKNTSQELKSAIGSDSAEVNKSFDKTINVAENTLPAVWYVVFASMLLGLFITAWFMPTHPIMVAPFIILLVIAIIVGVAMSNAYEKLYEQDALTDMASHQTSIDFIMSKLPYMAAIIGVITLIITFAKPGRENAPIS